MKISVADIGLDVTTVEQKLDEYFQLATRWKAILLLDESDVLLAQRGKDLASYESNSVVSGKHRHHLIYSPASSKQRLTTDARVSFPESAGIL